MTTPWKCGHPKRILITGASGFIGNAALFSFTSRGYEVVGVARRAPILAPLGCSFVKLDLASHDAQDALDALGHFDAVLHCAAIIPSSYANATSAAISVANERIDGAIIEFCRKHKTRLVYCSGTAVYGLVSGRPVHEDHLIDLGAPHYIASKIRSELLIYEQLQSFAILRICAPYGPGQIARTVLKIFIETAIAGGVLRYQGCGSRQQDFLHVSDVIEAFHLVLTSADIANIFNLAGGSPISMRELAFQVVEVVGNCSSRVEASGEADLQENYRARFDIGRARTVLNWRPQVPLRDGIKEWARYLQQEGK